MTRREWMAQHYPEQVMERYGGTATSLLQGGCFGCPWEYEELPGTEELCDPEQSCETCWTREVPATCAAEAAEIISDLKDID